GTHPEVSTDWSDEDGGRTTLVMRTERIEKAGVVVLRKRSFAVEEGQVVIDHIRWHGDRTRARDALARRQDQQVVDDDEVAGRERRDTGVPDLDRLPRIVVSGRRSVDRVGRDERAPCRLSVSDSLS